MKLKELRKIGKERIKSNNIEDSLFKIDILLQYFLNMNKTELIINFEKEIDDRIKDEFFQAIQDLTEGKPIQYITNMQEFMNLKFYVDENVLIPQPDTEILVEESIKIIESFIENNFGIKENSKNINLVDKEGKFKKIKILDLCTGSGAIAVSLENYLINKYKEYWKNKIEIYASDISEKALEIAKKNANANNKNSEIKFIKSDLFENIDDIFDIIISNPPYIETSTIQSLSKEVQSEPHIALDGGEDGLMFYRKLAQDSKDYLKPNGVILLEIGYNQKKDVTELLNKNNFSNIICRQDLGGNDRVVLARKMEE